MATKHDVTFRADGDVEIKFETDGKADCLKIKSRRQELHVALTPEQGNKLVSLFTPKSDVPDFNITDRAGNTVSTADDKPPQTAKKKAAKKSAKKSTKKKKATKKKGE